MGLYSQHIFPRLCDRAMRDARFEVLRRSLLAQAVGNILEIGFGTGLNLEHYPAHVRHITAIDPGAGMSRISKHRIARSQKPDCQQRSVFCSGFADRERSHRNAGRHLGDGKQRIDAAQRPGLHGNPQHRQMGLAGAHPRQMSRPAGAGDYDGNATCFSA